MLFLILLPSQGEVARSAETEGFSLPFESNWQENAYARQRTLPSRFAIHLPLVREGVFHRQLQDPQTYVEGYALAKRLYEI